MSDIHVNQKPISIVAECDNCENEIEIDYNEFIKTYGDPPDW